ncbi:Serine carboxypeptidase 3 [Ananas comosus]|uniref:Serine carboxypeptidase 3 n=1 Tax=Ananas comosus TaxID=4615 RepID=A0A199V365_ANACO|nr:Serine carboxypeptidase 3 [Ananas comosus]
MSSLNPEIFIGYYSLPVPCDWFDPTFLVKLSKENKMLVNVLKEEAMKSLSLLSLLLPLSLLLLFASTATTEKRLVERSFAFPSLCGTAYYDIRKECLGSHCCNFSNIEKFLNLKSVKSILGVENREFELCSDSVYEALEDDWMMNYEVGIPALLEDGIKLLVYAGEYDLICNWLGNSRWVRSMKWSGQKDFVSSTKIPFMVDGEKKGVLQSHGALSFLKVQIVHRAGHMVPLDQPKAALEMLKRWTQGKLNEIPSNN